MEGAMYEVMEPRLGQYPLGLADPTPPNTERIRTTELGDGRVQMNAVMS
jgi:hypothetical protein